MAANKIHTEFHAASRIWLILGAVALLFSSIPATVHVVCEHDDACPDSSVPSCLVCAKLVGNPPADTSLPELPLPGAFEFREETPAQPGVRTGGIVTRGRAPPFGSSSV